MITIDQLIKRYDGRAVLREVSLRVEPKTVVALVGPSGSGKSTLLRCINGLERFDSGTIRIGDDVLRGGEQEPRVVVGRIRRRVGFVFQQFHLFAHMTALENVVEAPVHVLHAAPNIAREEARALLDKVGLLQRGGAYPHQMSGGEQQRVAIARALAMKPEVLLLDEPTSALDPERAGEVLSVLRTLAAGGTTMLLVTHELRFAREVADRAAVIAEGAIIEEGVARDVLTSPKEARTRAFLGHYAATHSPSKNAP